MSLNKIASKNSKENMKKIIKEYMDKRDYPDWYRGLSHFQMEAADSLQNNIRDDSQQGTTHRVRAALIKLGIEPLVSDSKIKFAMRLSRGNDMAFLWFLMELYYRHTCDECRHRTELGYSLIEQLIMTAIAHLDMIPTLRELDKLLPQQPSQPKKKKKPKPTRPKREYPLPYFATQPKPVEYGKKLTLFELDNIPNLRDYDKYRNPNYVAPNENTKWFADYKLNEHGRIAKGIVKEQIENVFEREDAGTLGEYYDIPLFCAHHSAMELLKESMANELKVARKKAAEKYFDMDGRLKDQSYKRVMDMLDNEILKTEEFFDKFATRQHCPKKSLTVKPTDSNENATLDYGHAISPLGKKNFFEGPCHHKPYKFNYNRIFDMGVKNPVKDAISNALRECSSEDVSADHDRAVKKCCKDIWTEEVENFRKMAKEEEELQKQTASPEKNILGFDLPYYDPRDKQLMSSIVYKALQEIKKNKRFVLASMPNAHKCPILNEFAKKRYGLVYTRKEKISEFKKSKRIFHLLRKNKARVRLPEIKDLSENRIVSYGCKDYILKKTNYLKYRYHHNFKMTFMDEVRIYWGAMRPFQCTRGPPRDEFFSYFPARESDVHMFRPWQVGEYVRAKEQWDRQQKIKRMALLF